MDRVAGLVDFEGFLQTSKGIRGRSATVRIVLRAIALNYSPSIPPWSTAATLQSISCHGDP